MNTFSKERRGAAAAEAGFTLIEVCIAMLVMMVIAVAVAGLFLHSIRNNSGARSRTVALAVAQQQMEQLRAAGFNGLEAAVTSGGGSPKVVTSHGLQFTVTTSIGNTPASPAAPLVKRVTLTVAPINSGGLEWANTPVTFVVDRVTPNTGPYSK